jgi:hypothetical protein
MLGDAKEITIALRTGRFFLSVHAARRMRQRSITMADIQACAHTTESCIFQIGRGTFRVEGRGLDGQPLAVICGIDEGIIVITLFRGDRR